ncbi:SRPBCC domain-containing protein [Vibrio sp. SCSIO 43132]|uniref:SRPBCC family protein n=1 Tax=Vibrio sp. SCSIO 43132 TaxID=2779363 RepID=UPI001CA83490|nr:SRPBCC domain-containing protein [Vibrio sp. SCSIO 43132]UAB73071.1 SRPBCC domain-containing protein [Vibrio sp. SCSIO 43132]
MTSIHHHVVMETTPEKLYQAITSSEGLSNWWTKADATTILGENLSFYFGPQCDHKVEMQLVSLEKNRKVVWQCVEGPWQEMGHFMFIISEDERGAALSFTHEGWPEMGPFFGHCNCKWGLFIGLSLKSYLETGKGVPHPNEQNI